MAGRHEEGKQGGLCDQGRGEGEDDDRRLMRVSATVNTDSGWMSSGQTDHFSPRSSHFPVPAKANS